MWTDTGRMVLKWQGDVVADIPLGPLADDAPAYDRPHVPHPAAPGDHRQPGDGTIWPPIW